MGAIYSEGDQTELEGRYKENGRVLGLRGVGQFVELEEINGAHGEEVYLGVTRLTSITAENDGTVLAVRSTNAVVYGLGNLELRFSFAAPELIEQTLKALADAKKERDALAADFNRAVIVGEMISSAEEIAATVKRGDYNQSIASVIKKGEPVRLFSRTSEWTYYPQAEYMYEDPNDVERIRTIDAWFADLSVKEPIVLDHPLVFKVTPGASSYSLSSGVVPTPPDVEIEIDEERQVGKDKVPARFKGSIIITREMDLVTNALLDAFKMAKSKT